MLATVITVILMKGLSSIVKLGLDAQINGRGRNELAYQGRFALERIAEKARNTAPKALSTPAANTTGDWFSPTMYCRNSSNQLIEASPTLPITNSSPCDGPVIANNVTVFSAVIPTMGVVDRHNGVINITLLSGNNAMTLSTNVRLGGGAL